MQQSRGEVEDAKYGAWMSTQTTFDGQMKTTGAKDAIHQRNSPIPQVCEAHDIAKPFDDEGLSIPTCVNHQSLLTEPSDVVQLAPVICHPLQDISNLNFSPKPTQQYISIPPDGLN